MSELSRSIFDPESVGLPSDFALTACKLLDPSFSSFSPDVSVTQPDTSGEAVLVSSTDLFSPIVLSPYKQGYIACANVLSDLFAVGSSRIDSLLMTLCVSLNMSEEARTIVAAEMMRGFQDCAIAAGVANGQGCTGGQTIYNPWPLVGGTASSVVRSKSSLMRIQDAEVGHVIGLTKPLGTQVTGNLALWLAKRVDKWEVAKQFTSLEAAVETVLEGEKWMMQLNRDASKCLLDLGASSVTDVTGFGLVGHGQNLVDVQKQRASISYLADRLPVIRNVPALEKSVTVDYGVSRGVSAETSGGLLFTIEPEKVETLTSRLSHVWIIGRVVAGDGQFTVSNNVEILEV